MSVITLAVLGLLAGVAAGVIALLRRLPLVALTSFILVISFVPIWVLVPTPVASISLASAMAALVAAALIARTRAMRWSFADLLLAFLLVTAAGPVIFGLVSLGSALNVFIIWATALTVGRLALLHVQADTLYAVVAVIFGIVGLLAVVEFVVGWHALSSWGPQNGARVVWGGIQQRAGLDRAEGAFGHSIALGNSLAMAAVLATQARLPRLVRLALIACMVGGIGVTLSRGSLACLVLGLVLVLFFVHDSRVRELRGAMSVLAAVGAVVLAPFVLGVLADAGTEASGSAAYRSDLLSLLGVVEVLGRSAAIQTTAQGTSYTGGFSSIDNQLLIFGLNFGWVLLVVVLALFVAGAFALVTGRASSACVAVLAQAPAMVSVALITQYAVFFWFVVGLAAGAEQLRAARTEANPDVGRSPYSVKARSLRRMP